MSSSILTPPNPSMYMPGSIVTQLFILIHLNYFEIIVDLHEYQGRYHDQVNGQTAHHSCEMKYTLDIASASFAVIPGLICSIAFEKLELY